MKRLHAIPAAQAGLREGDIIVEFAGQPVQSSSQLRNLVATTQPNQKVNLTVLREGKREQSTAVMGKLTPQKPAAAAPRGELLSKYGLAVEPLTPEAARQHGYENEQGLLVTAVTPGTPAALANLQAGDLITQVNRQKVANLDELRQALAKSQDQNRVLLLINHEGQSTFIVLQVQ